MKTRGTLVPLLLALAAVPAEAAVNRWTSFGPGGGLISDFGVVPGNPSVIYAFIDGSLFRSLDGGTSWTWRGLPPNGPLSFDPEAPGTFYAADVYTDQVYQSLDSGASWAPLPTKPGGEVPTDLTVLEAVDGVLYGGGARGVFTSLDGGESWTRTPLTGAVSSIALVPSQPLIAYAGTPAGAWKTLDAGRHWAAVFPKPAGARVFLAVAPSRPDRVYLATEGLFFRSDDGGAVWIQVGALANVSGLTVDLLSADTIYAVDRDGVQVSTDQGATWRPMLDVPPVFENASEVQGIFADPNRPDTLYAPTVLHGLFVSRNRGDTWSVPAQDGLGFPTVLLFERDLRQPATLYLVRITAKSEDLLRSTDDGKTWQTVAYVPGQRDFAFDPGAPDAFYAAGNGIFRVEDGGGTWVPIGAPPNDSTLSQIIVRGRAIVVGSAQHLYRSLDGGATWRFSLSGNVVRLIEDPKDPKTFYALIGEQGYSQSHRVTVYRTRNGGDSWRRILSHAEGFALDPRRGRLWATQGQKLLFSRDRGLLWESEGDLPAVPWTLARDSARPGLLLLGSPSGVFLSRDAGRTWAPYNVGLAKLRRIWAEQLIADPHVPGRFFAIPRVGGLFEVTVK